MTELMIIAWTGSEGSKGWPTSDCGKISRPCPETAGHHVEPDSFRRLVLDPRSGELLRKGSRVKLQNQPLQVLLTLLERPGDVVSRRSSGSGSGRPTPSSTSIVG